MPTQRAAAASADSARVFDSLRRIVRHLRVFEGETRSAARVGPAQLFVLSRLAEKNASSIKELAERTMTDPSSVSVVVSKLVARGFVKRTDDPSDGRRQLLSLTSKGERALASVPVSPQARLVQALSDFPAARRRVLVRSLDDLVVALGAEASDPTLFFEDETPKARSRSRAR